VQNFFERSYKKDMGYEDSTPVRGASYEPTVLFESLQS
jgi:hypothetical protein